MATFSALNAGSLSPVDRDVTKGRAIPADEKRTGLYICIYIYIYIGMRPCGKFELENNLWEVKHNRQALISIYTA